MSKKRKDECLFCTSRSCYTKIIAENYEEIACGKHINDLEKHSDEVLGSNNGVQRIHSSSTGKQCRGGNWFEYKAKFDREIAQIGEWKAEKGKEYGIVIGG